MVLSSRCSVTAICVTPHKPPSASPNPRSRSNHHLRTRLPRLETQQVTTHPVTSHHALPTSTATWAVYPAPQPRNPETGSTHPACRYGTVLLISHGANIFKGGRRVRATDGAGPAARLYWWPLDPDLGWDGTGEDVQVQNLYEDLGQFELVPLTSTMRILAA